MLLSGDLAFYRVVDALNTRREENSLIAENEISAPDSASKMPALAAILAASITQFQAHNLLLNQAQAYEAECKRRFTQLEARIDGLEQQNAELRAAKEKAEAEVIEYAKANVRRILGESA